MEPIVFVFWYWWVLSIIFLVIEMLVSGFFFLWMSASALLTGILVWLFPAITTEIQFFVFSLLAIIAIISWKVFAKNTSITSDKPLLNKRGAQYVGRVFNLYEAIENGQGKIKVDDSIWKVYGEDCDIHTKVKVVNVNGTVFTVEKVIEE